MVLTFMLLFILERLFGGGYTGCMSSQQPFIPPIRGGKNNSMTNGGSGESISGSITTLGSGGRGLFHEEDEKRQADDVR